MKYRIDAKYCWYNKKTQLVLMYFINQIAFTFDDVPESYIYDPEILELADNERHYEPEDLFLSSYYLMLEQCHPLMFELELENPECMPVD